MTCLKVSIQSIGIAHSHWHLGVLLQVESLKASDSQLQDAVISLSKQRAELHDTVVNLEGEVRIAKSLYK